MKIFFALKLAEKILKKNDVAFLDSEVLFCVAEKKSKEWLLSNLNKKISLFTFIKFFYFVLKRKKGTPVAYIAGKKEFFGLEFYVNKNVLIPRPETEFLVEEIINHSKNKKISIADIGSGSGCIAISLAKNLPDATIYATELSTKANKILRKNILKHDVNIIYTQGNLLEPLKINKIDFIAANLPYLPISYSHPSIANEPALALYGGVDGLDAYRELFSQIKNRVQKPSKIFCEIEPHQTERINKIALDCKYYLEKIIKDYSGNNRVAVFTFSEEL